MPAPVVLCPLHAAVALHHNCIMLLGCRSGGSGSTWRSCGPCWSTTTRWVAGWVDGRWVGWLTGEWVGGRRQAWGEWCMHSFLKCAAFVALLFG